MKSNIARIVSAFPFLAVLGLAFILSLAKLDDLDIWWHLKCGELFLREGRILRQEIFSYTAQGAPWVDGYLLAQVIYYIAWRLAGAAGVCLLGAALVTVTFAMGLVFGEERKAMLPPSPAENNRRSGYGIMPLVLLASVFLSSDCMFPRPALFTPIFAIIFLKLLEEEREKGGKKVWWLLLLSALWANIHPAFFLGFIITGSYIPGSISDAKRRKRLLILLAGQIAASLVNPYGYKVFYSVISLITTPQFKQAIVEWRPIYSSPLVSLWILGSYAFVVATGLSLFCRQILRNRKRGLLTRDLGRFSIFIIFALAALNSRRNMLLFGAMAVPLISMAMAEVFDSRKTVSIDGPHRSTGQSLQIFSSVLVTIAAFFVIWMAATDRLYFHIRLFRSTGLGVQTALFPQGSADFLKSRRIEGNLFHPYGLGGYLIFELYPEYKVFIDGRIYPYSYELFEISGKAIVDNSVFEEIRKKYDVRAVLMPLNPPENDPLIEYLIRSPNWAAVYAEGAGVLFMERGVGNDGVISRNEMNLLDNPPELPTRPPGRKLGLFDLAEFPYGIMGWGMLYERLGRPDLAVRVLEKALNYRPVIKELEAEIGGLMIKSGRLAEGLELIRKAMKRTPEDPVALRGLADYYVAVGEYSKAERIMLDMADKGPPSPQLWGYLGHIAYLKKDYSLAASRYQKAVQMEPGNADLWLGFAASLEFVNARAAIDAYGRVLKMKESSGAPPEEIEQIKRKMEGIGH